MSGSESGLAGFDAADSAAGMGSYLLRPLLRGAAACRGARKMIRLFLLHERGAAVQAVHGLWCATQKRDCT